MWPVVFEWCSIAIIVAFFSTQIIWPIIRGTRLVPIFRRIPRRSARRDDGFCSHCGIDVHEDSKYCPSCGAMFVAK